MNTALRLERIDSEGALLALAPEGIAPLDVESYRQHKPDAHWIAARDGGAVEARCSLWWNRTPPYLTHRVGAIGHFAACSGEAASSILTRAQQELVARGCTIAIGPMDGNTWRSYRFVTEVGAHPPFFLEPANPPEYPRWFVACGFEPLARYCSAATDDLDAFQARDAGLLSEARKSGVAIEPMQTDDAGLREVFALSLEGFASNVLYTPAEADEFLSQYRKMLPFIRPELATVARVREQAVGFMFALPDVLQGRRGETVDTIIMKSMAVQPDWQGRGVGRLLFSHAHAESRRLGYRRAIHALMHQDNRSLSMSSQTATVIRRYTLYAKALSA